MADGSRDLRVQRRVVRYVHERPHQAVERSSEEHVGGTGSGTGCKGVVTIGQELDTMAQQYVDEYSKREPAEYEVSEPSEVTETLGQLYAGVIFSDGSMVVYSPCLGEATIYRDLELEALEECTPTVSHIHRLRNDRTRTNHLGKRYSHHRRGAPGSQRTANSEDWIS